jgi:hypothetical protein
MALTISHSSVDQMGRVFGWCWDQGLQDGPLLGGSIGWIGLPVQGIFHERVVPFSHHLLFL